MSLFSHGERYQFFGAEVDGHQTLIRVRMCDSKECPNVAEVTLFWTDGWFYKCRHCGRWMIEVGDAMAFDVPRTTVRKLERQEMYLTIHELLELVEVDGISSSAELEKVRKKLELNKLLYGDSD